MRRSCTCTSCHVANLLFVMVGCTCEDVDKLFWANVVSTHLRGAWEVMAFVRLNLDAWFTGKAC